MKRYYAMGASLLLVGLGLVGCGNTKEGVEQDTANNTQAVGNAATKAADATTDAAKDAGTATKNAMKDAGAATQNAAESAGSKLLTPKIKSAIIADKQLNNPANEINVDTKDGAVVLTGHVASSALKSHATAVAQKSLADSKSTFKVTNNLTVGK